MKITMRKIFEEKNISVKNSVYKDYKHILDYEFADCEFWTARFPQEKDVVYEKVREWDKEKKFRRNDKSYIDKTQKLETIKQREKEITKKWKETHDNKLQEEINDLRKIKKCEQKSLTDFKQQTNRDISEIIYGDIYEDKASILQHKKCVDACSLSEMSEYLPQLKKIQGNQIYDMPWFINDFEKLAKVKKENRNLAVMGGPCLFGAYEAGIIIKLENGEEYEFDFTDGEEIRYKLGTLTDTIYQDIIKFIENKNDEIVDVNYILHKEFISEQEYDSLQYVFEFAKALDAKAFIPLPDFSYQKYINYVMSFLNDDVLRTKAKESFSELLDKSLDIQFYWIDKLKAEYPDVLVTVFYRKTEKLLECFETKRMEYAKSGDGVFDKVTKKSDRKESIIDYVTMPAIPFFFENITDIVEIDCISELESYRKCQKLYKNYINIYPIFYIERLSKDGINQNFYARMEDKEYKKSIN